MARKRKAGETGRKGEIEESIFKKAPSLKMNLTVSRYTEGIYTFKCSPDRNVCLHAYEMIAF